MWREAELPLRWRSLQTDPEPPPEIKPDADRQLTSEAAAEIEAADPELRLLPGEDRLDLRVALQPLGHRTHAVADVPLALNVAGSVGGLALRVEAGPAPTNRSARTGASRRNSPSSRFARTARRMLPPAASCASCGSAR